MIQWIEGADLTPEQLAEVKERFSLGRRPRAYVLAHRFPFTARGHLPRRHCWLSNSRRPQQLEFELDE